jgi:hypothetical protein
MDGAVVLRCAHQFHYECLERFTQQSTSDKCPQCGADVRIDVKRQKELGRQQSSARRSLDTDGDANIYDRYLETFKLCYL